MILCYKMCFLKEAKCPFSKSLFTEIQFQNFPSYSGSFTGDRPVCLKDAWLTGDSRSALLVSYFTSHPDSTSVDPKIGFSRLQTNAKKWSNGKIFPKNILLISWLWRHRDDVHDLVLCGNKVMNAGCFHVQGLKSSSHWWIFLNVLE